MIDIDALEALAKAAESGSPGDRFMFALSAMDPAGVLALIAEVRALREDKARLDSGCIMTNGRDEFGDGYVKCERRGVDLRKMIDEAIAARAEDRA